MPCPRFGRLFCAAEIYSPDAMMLLPELRRLERVCTLRSVYGLYSFARSFMRKMPVPGFSITVTNKSLLEW